jgi:hypothetical protein
MITMQLQCDWCKKGFVWGKQISRSDVEVWAMDNGWEMGRKEHICPDCLSSEEQILVGIKDEEFHDRVMQIFNRYYRTQHARLKAKNKRITRTQLKIWTEKARQARILVEKEKYSVEEFIKYLEGEPSALIKELGELDDFSVSNETSNKFGITQKREDEIQQIYNLHYRKIRTHENITKSQLDIWAQKASYAQTLVELGVYTKVDFINYLTGEDSEITKDLGELTWD